MAARKGIRALSGLTREKRYSHLDAKTILEPERGDSSHFDFVSPPIFPGTKQNGILNHSKESTIDHKMFFFPFARKVHAINVNHYVLVKYIQCLYS